MVVYNRTSATPIWTDASFGDEVQSVAVTPDGRKIAAASWGRRGGTIGNVISVYERDSSIPLWTIGDDAIAGVGSCMSVDLSENGCFLLAGGKAVHAREFGTGGFVMAIDVASTAGIPDIGGAPALTAGPRPTDSASSALPTPAPLRTLHSRDDVTRIVRPRDGFVARAPSIGTRNRQGKGRTRAGKRDRMPSPQGASNPRIYREAEVR